MYVPIHYHYYYMHALHPTMYYVLRCAGYYVLSCRGSMHRGMYTGYHHVQRVTCGWIHVGMYAWRYHHAQEDVYIIPSCSVCILLRTTTLLPLHYMHACMYAYHYCVCMYVYSVEYMIAHTPDTWMYGCMEGWM